MNDLQKYHPSQVLRYCPFCGAADFEWDGFNAHVCKHCGHKLYVNSAAAVVALIQNEAGELLLVRRKFDPAQGTLDLPGGFVNIGEAAEDAVCREVKEELNLEVTETTFWHSFPNQYLYGGIVYFTTDLVFVCKVLNFTELEVSDDVSGSNFLPINSIKPEQIGLASIKNVITCLQKSASIC
ncbi:DNA mismatch repair protein MutT [Bacteroidia bacterium]|nr:DNA mismatch repair protein MutT [Bacteroidia bacterium]